MVKLIGTSNSLNSVVNRDSPTLHINARAIARCTLISMSHLHFSVGRSSLWAPTNPTNEHLLPELGGEVKPYGPSVRRSASAREKATCHISSRPRRLLAK